MGIFFLMDTIVCMSKASSVKEKVFLIGDPTDKGTIESYMRYKILFFKERQQQIFFMHSLSIYFNHDTNTYYLIKIVQIHQMLMKFEAE